MIPDPADGKSPGYPTPVLGLTNGTTYGSSLALWIVQSWIPILVRPWRRRSWQSITAARCHAGHCAVGMSADGSWQDRRHRLPSPHQPRRRRDCLGELVQIDGSEHAWFEDRGARCTPLAFVDDATSRLKQFRSP